MRYRNGIRRWEEVKWLKKLYQEKRDRMRVKIKGKLLGARLK